MLDGDVDAVVAAQLVALTFVRQQTDVAPCLQIKERVAHLHRSETQLHSEKVAVKNPRLHQRQHPAHLAVVLQCGSLVGI